MNFNKKKHQFKADAFLLTFQFTNRGKLFKYSF